MSYRVYWPAVVWAASFAERYDAELIIVQVVISQSPASTEHGAAEHTRAAAAGEASRDADAG